MCMDDELLTPKSKVHEQLKHLQNNKEINLVTHLLFHIFQEFLLNLHKNHLFHELFVFVFLFVTVSHDLEL